MPEFSFPIQLMLAEVRGRVWQALGIQGFEGARATHLRQVAAFVMSESRLLPRQAIAEALSMSPTWVDYSIKSVRARMRQHPAFAQEVDGLVAALKPPSIRRV
jgi:hypothetical protein